MKQLFVKDLAKEIIECVIEIDETLNGLNNVGEWNENPQSFFLESAGNKLPKTAGFYLLFTTSIPEPLEMQPLLPLPKDYLKTVQGDSLFC